MSLSGSYMDFYQINTRFKACTFFKENLLSNDPLCPLLLTWFNFNPSMDK